MGRERYSVHCRAENLLVRTSNFERSKPQIIFKETQLLSQPYPFLGTCDELPHYSRSNLQKRVRVCWAVQAASRIRLTHQTPQISTRIPWAGAWAGRTRVLYFPRGGGSSARKACPRLLIEIILAIKHAGYHRQNVISTARGCSLKVPADGRPSPTRNCASRER